MRVLLGSCLATGLLLASQGAVAADPVTADINGDGLDDVVVIDGDSGTVAVLLNTTAAGAGEPSYAEAVSFAVDGYAVSVVAADRDEDGRPDLVVTDEGGHDWLLRNTTEAGAGTASFADAVPLDDAGAGATPDPFSFTDQVGVARSTLVISDTVTLSGIADRAVISVTGGRYSIGCTSKFTASTGSIRDGQRVCVRHTSSADYGTATDTILTVGGVSDTFTSVTAWPNTLPVAFTFIDVREALMNTPQVSNTVTIEGIDGAAPIEVSGGEYSIGCDGAFTAAAGGIAGGDRVCVRHTSAATPDTSTHTTLTVGGRSDTFTSTTPAPLNLTQAGALGATSGLLGLLAVLGLARRPRRPRHHD